MSFLSSQWRTFQRRWRVFRRLGQCSTVPWLLLTIVILESSVVTASSYHPAIVQPPPQYAHRHHHPPPSVSPRSFAPPHPSPPGPPMQSPMITAPSQAPNPNLYYTIDQGNKLVQRQMPPGPGGITAAATNYLLQQIQNEQLQQQRSIVSQPRAQPQMQQSPSSQQQQTLQLLASMSPQQIAALQSVLPSLPRNNPLPQQQQQQPQPIGIPIPVPVSGAQAVHQQNMDPQLQFASRMGPFDKFFNKAKTWLPDVMASGSGHSKLDHGVNSVGEPKMRDLHRLPKPPKYPLYDLPSVGLATPPPAPIMHPIATLPKNAFDLNQPQLSAPMQSSSPRSPVGGHMAGSSSSYNQQNWISPSPTMSTSRRSRPVPPRTPRPSKPSFLRNTLGRIHKRPRPSSESPPNYNRRNERPGPPPGRQPPRLRNRGPPPTSLPSFTKPPTPKKGGPHRGRFPPSMRRPTSTPTVDGYQSSSGSGSQMGFDHPMASNLSPAQSPALGRPLSYEEYMARPSHSYTDDPWNFDPFASQMNSGLHTHALRYNYDPLGMNALDTEANSHLDPNKLSYPGDSFNQDMVKDSPGITAQGQIGGWDKPYKKRTYDSDPDTELTPPGRSPGYNSNQGPSYSSNQGSSFNNGGSSSFNNGGSSSFNNGGSSSFNNGGSSSFNNGGSPFSSSPNDPYSPPSSLGSSSNRYKNSGSSGASSYQSNSGNVGSGFLGDALSGGRRGEIPNDPFPGSSDLQPFNFDDQRQDSPPTIDLDSLSPQQDDDGGLEFTIETSMDKGHNEGFEDTPQPGSHPLGPMQPAPDPFLSDQYSPYGEQNSPSESSIPGMPYGPNGYSHRDNRKESRYGRRRTRNNNNSAQRRSLRNKIQTQFQQKQLQIQQQQQHQQQQQQQQQQHHAQEPVPEGVQIFNEIIRPELEKLQTPSTRQHSNQNRSQLRKQLYSAIRESDKK